MTHWHPCFFATGYFALYRIKNANKAGCDDKHIIKTLETCLVFPHKLGVFF
jgi:hypothetical protein